MKKLLTLKKDANKGITLIALIITIIVLLILAGVAIATLVGENGILTQAQNAKKDTTKAEAKERVQLEVLGSYGTDGKIDIATLKTNIAQNIPEATIGEETELPLTVTVGEYTFTVKANGTVEEVKPPTEEDDTVEGDTSGAIPPVLKDGMQAITFASNGAETVVTDTSKNNWYSYEVQTTATDTYNEETGEYGTSHWANAKLNGNYYVWIPRYAYKIDTSVTYTSQSGTSNKIDVKFIGTDVTSENVATKVGEGYIVHPAFTFGTVGETTTPNELAGIWVGKYESSNDGNGNVKIIPNVTSYREIDVATMFTKAQALSTTNNDAHMMKNIEWGAVAYLAQSQYGRNGTEISVNQCSDYITGAGRSVVGTGETSGSAADLGTGTIFNNSTYSVDTETNLPPEDQQYNGRIGKLSSTTGNIYGVYDMSGGTYEYVMGFYGTAEDTPTLGNTGFTTETIPTRKYYDLYINKTNADSSNIGDALYETKGWNGDYAYFVNSNIPVFLRSGYSSDSSCAGTFGFYYYTGDADFNSSFRVCLAVQ